MEKKRFYYNRSIIYGWCVYDRQTNMPAYEACCDLLSPVSDNEEGKVCVSPIFGDNHMGEYAAMRLCTKLNVAWKRYCIGNNQQ